MTLFDKLNAAEWMKFNAALQKKKHNVRKKLKEKGVLQRKGVNDFDHYKYFTEAQYKELFTELFTDEGLELTSSAEDVQRYEGSAKQPHGRMISVRYTLSDIDTGFYESVIIPGDGMDKGDKGIYQAYTGSLKYYLANTFMVSTGDDPEVPNKEVEKKISKAQAKTLGQLIEQFGVKIETVCEEYEHNKLEEFTGGEYAEVLRRLDATKKKQEGKE